MLLQPSWHTMANECSQLRAAGRRLHFLSTGYGRMCIGYPLVRYPYSYTAVDLVPNLNCPFNGAGGHSSPSPTALDMGDAAPQAANRGGCQCGRRARIFTTWCAKYR
eukprot:3941375-Rhodomonas_salina.1